MGWKYGWDNCRSHGDTWTGDLQTVKVGVGCITANGGICNLLFCNCQVNREFFDHPVFPGTNLRKQGEGEY
jgi:hypothetical protein